MIIAPCAPTRTYARSVTTRAPGSLWLKSRFGRFTTGTSFIPNASTGYFLRVSADTKPRRFIIRQIFRPDTLKLPCSRTRLIVLWLYARRLSSCASRTAFSQVRIIRSARAFVMAWAACDAKTPAQRGSSALVGIDSDHSFHQAEISAACFSTSFSLRSFRFSGCRFSKLRSAGVRLCLLAGAGSVDALSQSVRSRCRRIEHSDDLSCFRDCKGLPAVSSVPAEGLLRPPLGHGFSFPTVPLVLP